MAADGKQLEAVVAFVEEALVPHSFTLDEDERMVAQELLTP